MCGVEFDVRQSMMDEPLKVCENCGGELRKIINSVGIVFKGSGFYHNDSKSKDNSSMQAHVSHTNESARSIKHPTADPRATRTTRLPRAIDALIAEDHRHPA